MNKFARISEFEMLTESDAQKLFGGAAPTTKTATTVAYTTTAGCTNNMGTTDSCTDKGQGTDTMPD